MRQNIKVHLFTNKKSFYYHANIKVNNRLTIEKTNRNVSLSL